MQSNDLGRPDGTSGNRLISEHYTVGGDAAQPMTPTGVGAGISAGIPADAGWLMGTNAASPAPSPQGVPGPNGAPGISHVDAGVSPLADLQNFLIGDDNG